MIINDPKAVAWLEENPPGDYRTPDDQYRPAAIGIRDPFIGEVYTMRMIPDDHLHRWRRDDGWHLLYE